MILKIRVILDTEQDVFRDIEIEDKRSLLELHTAIKKAFSLKGEEMASFFLSNDQWFQGSEIPMEDMSGEEDAETMANVNLKSVIPNKGGKMIYLYDFLQMWTFYCEVLSVAKKENNKVYPNVSYTYGECPAEPPQKESMHFDIEDDLEEEDLSEDYLEEDDFDENPYGYY